MSEKRTILVIEDEHAISNFICRALSANDYKAIPAASGKEGLSLFFSHSPDLVLLDLGLPDMDGLEVLSQLSGLPRETPVIIISARDRESEKVKALDMGADDYVVKPFGVSELLARIRTALRHTRTALEDDSIALNGSYQVGDLLIDYRKHRVYLAGNDVGLTPNEFRIVALLGKHAGQVITYQAMLRELWGPYASRDNKILRVHMANIRRKIEPNPDEPRYIFTEVGVGYRMSEE